MSYSKVKIAARLRPPIPGEQHDKAIRVLQTDSGAAICVDNPRDPSQTFKYPFSSCYGESSKQEEIFRRDVQPLIELAFSGLTVTVFAYGVTSSGKTHTMQGSKDQPGIIPRAVEDIFTRAALMDCQASIAISYMEIYKDEVFDLLVDREKASTIYAAKLPVRESEGGKVFVANLSMLPVATLQDFDRVFARANKQRSVSSTNLNSVSSRSHAILTLHVAVADRARNMTLSGKLNLVDLAGSENNKLTGNDGSRMAESAAINKSLSVLGQVVHALNQGASRIPYRNSKLTRILQDALGGNSVGLLICNLAPGTKFRQDTLNTLNFAVRTKNIQNKPVVNQVNAVAGPSQPSLLLPAASTSSGRPSLAPIASNPVQSRLPGPRPSRVPRPSAIEPLGPRSSLPGPEIIRTEATPPTVPAHLTEEEINARIAKAVELEVARRLQEEREREHQRREEEEASIAASRSASVEEGESALQSLPSGLLTPLLKSSRASHEDELKRRLDELEARFERANKAIHLADALSPLSRKKTGRAYVALARSQTQKNHLQVALDLYRKAETYVPDNVKLKERIIEIEWAVKNNKPLSLSPKKSRRSHTKHDRSKPGRRKPKLDPECDDVPEEEEDISGKENMDESRSPGKRRIKTQDGDLGTPPKKRRLMKLEE
ncbi:P-loop containing nucleoside triphosphate hydrolase protein [Daedaleopsis nitida]|nr:P-loop containing nucleoside triphosphate hydrolase protein [Daedaleopsis nitida]